MKKLLLSVIMAGALASPAAAATISFTAGTTDSTPSWTSAQVIESFNQTGQFLTVGQTNTVGTETLSGGGTARISTGNSAMVGKYLTLSNGKSLTLSFGSSPVQFLSFLIDNYNRADQVFLTYTDNVVSQNILSSISGLTFGRDGAVIIDQQGGRGISKIQFTSSGENSSFLIDEIAVAAPEPATWGMMLLGFGIVGSQLRRRRHKGKFAAA